ncbi:hypothetical protein ABB37_05192 [Leptomonas pyrrhocoris]|uniref:Cullin neddylation domain-containing protein n=1 Tax=Leptomonas pyrrhocoris TaxID=157538 RepID=A0A0N0DVE4_LEPPY|nr:hypothetical protein ABB37_05192 [Leptomonas pyrrhocoris]KPA80218.1 hypothetical protein ABB37_05192 [Leptomonas pyrrhocoris]|eukprot:XP_015658657.1 hypothetical protein ABB37_05192 [Leptomonas pyrrhocoris]
MTVSLHSLIEEWEAINHDLFKASLESHRRYPFPVSLFSPDSVTDLPSSRSAASSSSTSDSSTAAYARVYHWVSRVRHIAEDARYNSFFILQHLLWVTIIAWANQMAVASGGLVVLPASVQQRNSTVPSAADAGSSGLMSFRCSLLAPLTFWDPGLLGEATGGSPQDNDIATENSMNVSMHRTPNLRVVWADAVQRIIAVWCTTTATSSKFRSDAQADNSGSGPSLSPSSSPSSLATTDGVRAASAGFHVNNAYAWVVLAQHYHRFKAILALFFLRYDAHVEEMEELRRRPGQQQQQQLRTEANELSGGASGFHPLAPPLRRRGPHLRVSSDVSGSSTLSTAARTAATGRNHRSGGDARLNDERTSDDRTPMTATASNRSSPPLPTTARLLALIMRNIETENINAITEATGETLILLFMPPVHRARLHEKLVRSQQKQGSFGGTDVDAEAKRDVRGVQQGKEDSLTEPERMVGVLLDGCAIEEDDGDDDKVVWSAPLSPLLSFASGAVPPSSVHLTPADERVSPGNANSNGEIDNKSAVMRVPPLLGRAQKEEYVVRNMFKLLLMIEDCRVHALQNWLMETGKHVVAVYGSQLASFFFEEPNALDTKSNEDGNENEDSGLAVGTVSTPALTVRTFADANRVLRETIQSYVRLRTKLLFFNAGTTHFLGALTPWGRTYVLEHLNAFLCGFCGVTLPSSFPSNADRTTDAAQYFTPTNAAVATFARRWAVPLWLAMCEDAQHRLDALKKSKQKGDDQRQTATAKASGTGTPSSSQRVAAQNPEKREEVNNAKSQRGVRSEGHGSASKSSLPSFAERDKKELSAGEVAGVGEEAELRSTTEGQELSVASADLGDAVSRAPSEAWPPPSLATGRSATGGSGGGGRGTRNFAHARSRGVDMRRVLQQRQRQRVPLGSVLQRRHADTGVRRAALQGESNGSDGGGLESLDSAEMLSMGETSQFLAATSMNVTAEGGARGNDDSDGTARDGVNSEAGSNEAYRGGGGEIGVPANSVEVAVAAARHRRRQVAAAAQDQGTIVAAPGITPRFSRAEQLHQVATLPDEGFPSLTYLMPRRSRFIAQDKAAASVQQKLFTRFSSDVHNYLTSFLADCEASEGDKEGNDGGSGTTTAGKTTTDATPRAATGSDTKAKKRKDTAVRPALKEDVRPLPQAMLTRMIFLLDMTYAALQGSDHGDAKGPLMETGLTATGQELGVSILEQDNGEYESVVSTTLSAPTSPAILTIAAVRKGFQGFFATNEKRAALTLAQALYGLIQQGIARQPPTVSVEAVDTILNMASLLSSKDMFVSLMKGYIAPSVMMCRLLSDTAVESQVVARMAYRLGSAVAAPCLTLLRDLRLAASDPLNAVSEPLSLAGEGEDGMGERGQESHANYHNTDSKRSGIIVKDAQRVATREVQMLAAAGSLRRGSFGLIHRVRVLCQAWWQPHTAVLLSSRTLQRLWERYQLLDERIIDAVLRVEWRYEGHTEPFYGYGRIAGDAEVNEGDTDDDGRSRGGVSKGEHARSGSSGASIRGTASATAANVLSGGTAAAVIQGFSSALSNAVRRTRHHAGAFGNNESDNESEDYSEAYGGLLTLNTLQQHRGAYVASNSSHRGSNVSSMGGGGGAGAGERWDISDGGQSTAVDEAASTTVPPDGERERRQLRWPLGDGKLVFLLYPKGSSTVTAASQAVQITGPPLTLLVCQLMDRVAENPYTFDKLHKALPAQSPKPLLAHLLHELVKAGVVTRSVPAGKRQYIYQLRADVQRVHQRKVVIDIHAAAQQQWIVRTLTAAEPDADEDADRRSQRDPMSPANPSGANPSFSSTTAHGARSSSVASYHAEASGNAAGARAGGATTRAAAAATTEQSSAACLTDRTHKIKVCIVRIMKAERVLPHRELLERVAAALEDQFVVTTAQFKRCVAHLLEKEFLQRSDDGAEYMYSS